jgi:hypothetical protein
MKYVLKFILLISFFGCVKQMDRDNPLDGKTLPLITTNGVSTFTSTNAVISGRINSNGGLPILSKGMVYSITPNAPVDLMSKLSNGTGDPVFTTNITSLNPAAKYYVRAFASNLMGTAYGSEISFTTRNDTPYITTTVPNPVLYNNTMTGGNIIRDNGTPITVRGIVFGNSPYPTTELSQIVNNDTAKGIGPYLIKMPTLKPGATYYIRAYARNGSGRAYGNQVIFNTPATTPTFTTIPPTAGSTSSTSGGTFVSNGGSVVKDKGLVWSLTPIAPTTPLASIPSSNKISKGAGDFTFSANMSPLLPGTLYYVYAYATNDAGTSYGTQETFTTDPITPIVSTGSYGTPGPTSVDISSIILDDGGSPIKEFGYLYSVNPNPSLNNGATKFIVGTTTGTDRKNISFLNTLKGLTANTYYYVKAYATNQRNLTGYGTDLYFKTSASVPTIAISAPAGSNLTDVSARITATITSNGGANITSSGIYWSRTPGVTTASNKIPDYSGSQSTITSNMTGLSANTTYFVRAYAVNTSVSTPGLSSEISFITPNNAPTLQMTSSLLNGDNTINVSARILTQGLNAGSFVTSKGFILGTTSPLTINNALRSSYSLGNGGGDIVYLFQGLNPGVTYYISAYATNNSGASYGYSNEVVVKTNSVPPTVVTYDPSGASSSGVNVSGEVTNEGGEPVVDAGIEWGISTSSFALGNSGNKGTGLGRFYYTIPYTGLPRNRTYYYRAYARQLGKPTAYGNVKSFYVP